MKFIRSLSLVGCMLVLSGCATLDFASFGASGISYLVSGKSLSDHVVSLFKNQDCAMHRKLQGKAACIPHEQSDQMLAKADTTQPQFNDSLPTNRPPAQRDANGQQVATNEIHTGENIINDPFNAALPTVTTAE